MSHFVRVKNNRLIKQQRGIKPSGDDWAEVVKKWARPEAYPSNFYAPDSNVPRLTVVGNEVHETWGFNLKPVEIIKSELYEEHKFARYKLQLGSFIYKSDDILIGDRETSLTIAALPEVKTNYKISSNNWLVLSARDVVDFKLAHQNHVQAAFDWEMDANAEVDALTTHDELSAYILD